MILKSSGHVHILVDKQHLSDQGHLCNEDGADAMIRTIGNKPKKRSYLGHLSKENNIKGWPTWRWKISWRVTFGVGTDFKVFDTSLEHSDTHSPRYLKHKRKSYTNALVQLLKGKCYESNLSLSGNVVIRFGNSWNSASNLTQHLFYFLAIACFMKFQTFWEMVISYWVISKLCSRF